MPIVRLLSRRRVKRTRQMTPDYYIAQAQRLLRNLDKSAKRFRKVMASRFPDREIDQMMRETRNEFQRLIPEIPYIGGRENSFTQPLVGCTMLLALYRVLKRQGMSTEEIGRIAVEAEEERVRSYPRVVRTLLGWILYSPLGRRRLEKIARDSQKRQYPGGWVATYIEGDGKEFDFGIDYIECGLCKFFRQQDAGEFTRYLCLLDYAQQRAMNTGFFRSTTLAEGAERCDFRWKAGRETRPGWPPSWLE
jgi:hypothetical protein